MRGLCEAIISWRCSTILVSSSGYQADEVSDSIVEDEGFLGPRPAEDDAVAKLINELCDGVALDPLLSRVFRPGL